MLFWGILYLFLGPERRFLALVKNIFFGILYFRPSCCCWHSPLLPGKLISRANSANFGIDHEKCWNMRHSGHIYGIFELSECFKALGDYDATRHKHVNSA